RVESSRLPRCLLPTVASCCEAGWVAMAGREHVGVPAPAALTSHRELGVKPWHGDDGARFESSPRRAVILLVLGARNVV
ncbi:hypothetical protein L195_g037752, partial [Trifolium pratense]